MDEWRKKRDVMRRYDLTAHLYDARYRDEQTAKIEAALKHLDVSNLSCVLDVGCGTGILFSHVAGKARLIVGLDISKRTLMEARNHLGGFRNVCLVQADADNIPFVGAAFDCVFALTLLQNVPAHERTLNEIVRVAGSGASVAVTGLKKAFARNRFEMLLHDAGLKIAAFEDEDLKCHVAVCRVVLH